MAYERKTIKVIIPEVEGSVNMGHAQRTIDERPQDASEDLTICGDDDFLAEQGVADPDEFRVKSHLGREIASIAESRKLTQAAAAEIAGQKQSDLSRIITHRHNDYSVWRLMKMLSTLGADILVTVNPSGAFEKGIIYSKNVNDHRSIEPESPPFSRENYELDRVPGETDQEYADRLARSKVSVRPPASHHPSTTKMSKRSFRLRNFSVLSRAARPAASLWVE